MNLLYKYCPACNTANTVSSLLCACGADLSGTIPRRVVSARLKTENTPQTEVACSLCERLNPPYLVLCRNCGTELARKEESSTTLTLDLDGLRKECGTEEVLGREGSLEPHFFRKHPTVSRQHLRIYQQDGSWWMEVLAATTNATWFQQEKLMKGQTLKIISSGPLQLSKTCTVQLILGNESGYP